MSSQVMTAMTDLPMMDLPRRRPLMIRVTTGDHAHADGLVRAGWSDNTDEIVRKFQPHSRSRYLSWNVDRDGWPKMPRDLDTTISAGDDGAELHIL